LSDYSRCSADALNRRVPSREEFREIGLEVELSRALNARFAVLVPS
jgi:hypothetical protein